MTGESGNRVTRIVLAFGTFGIMPTKVATMAGMDPKNLRAIMGGETEPREATILKLLDLLRDVTEQRFLGLAQKATFPPEDLGMLRAMVPAAERLARTLRRWLDDAENGPWPRKLTAQEIAERLRDQQVELAMIEANEEAERQDVASVSWGTPPPASK